MKRLNLPPFEARLLPPLVPLPKAMTEGADVDEAVDGRPEASKAAAGADLLLLAGAATIGGPTEETLSARSRPLPPPLTSHMTSPGRWPLEPSKPPTTAAAAAVAVLLLLASALAAVDSENGRGLVTDMATAGMLAAVAPGVAATV